MQLTAQAIFFIVIFITSILGLIQGWKRGTLELAFLLGAILFLALGGGKWVTFLLFVRIPFIFGNGANVPADPSLTQINLTTLITFIAILVIGFLVARRVFPKPSTPVERLMGIIPGIVAGIALYVLFAITPIGDLLKSLSLRVSSPDQGVIGNSLLFLFIVVGAVLIIALIMSSSKKSAPKGK